MLARLLCAGVLVSCSLAVLPAAAQSAHRPGADACNVCLDGQCETCQIERGRPHRLLDVTGSVLGVFDKLALWDRRARNHDVSPETEAAVIEYMTANQLGDTKVRINQYAPGDEWRRLRDNKDVGAGWRYTLGAVYTLGYTIFPGRLLGRDSYNPYTDTVSIYSDLPPLALEQAAHAKIVNQQAHPGTYAVSYAIPFVSLFPEKRAKDDVHGYLQRWGTLDQRNEAYSVLTPQLGSEIGGQIGSLFQPAGDTILGLGGAAIGHTVKTQVRPPRQQQRRGLAGEPVIVDDRAVQPASAETRDTDWAR